MERHMFFGGNTPKGFYSKFEDILFLEDAVKIVQMKGSSGSGKSTLMRKVAKQFEDKGYDVDYIHCSNNITDLDGICIRELGLAMVDGTAPHVCDPTVPVGIDEIFNAADYIDREYVAERAKELLELQKAKKQYYDKAYNYLNAAYKIYLNNSYIYGQTLDKALLNKAIEKECRPFIKKKIAKKFGKNRRMFATAITPQGLTNYTESMLTGKKVVVLKGQDGMGVDKMLEAIKDAANSRGYATEGCYCSLNVDKLEHLIIPDLNICYTTINEYHSIGQKAHRTINFNEFVDENWILFRKSEIAFNKRMFDELIERSMSMMADQKEIHDEIEKIYIASMDFTGLDKASEKIIKMMLSYTGNKDCEV